MLSVIEYIFPEFTSAKFFTVCEVNNLLWHIELDVKSSYLTTFEMSYGRYKYCRMPFDISPAPEYFQQRLRQAIEKIPGVLVIADDILLAGCVETTTDTETDHDIKMAQLLDRCSTNCIKLFKDKLHLKCSEVAYMGHLITAEGLKPDPAKLEAIDQMPQPDDKKAVQRLMGMVNYLQKFARGISNITQPLRNLTKTDSDFLWEESVHGSAFETIKHMLSRSQLLRSSTSTNTIMQCFRWCPWSLHTAPAHRVCLQSTDRCRREVCAN